MECVYEQRGYTHAKQCKQGNAKEGIGELPVYVFSF